MNETTGKYEKDPACQSCADPGSAVEDNWVWSPMYAVKSEKAARLFYFETDKEREGSLSKKERMQEGRKEGRLK